MGKRTKGDDRVILIGDGGWTTIWTRRSDAGWDLDVQDPAGEVTSGYLASSPRPDPDLGATAIRLTQQKRAASHAV